MLCFLPGFIRGVVGLLLVVVNTCVWSVPILSGAILKLLIPIKGFRVLMGRIVMFFASTWVYCNTLILKLLHRIKWEVTGLDDLKPKDWYLVISNHQTWTDIVVLQTVFHGKIPFLKFFLKKELIWVPLLGLCWWALDYPFMRRYSSSFLEKNPHLKGQDIKITRKACEKFRQSPVSVMNFLEGTRFTPEKHLRQKSPYNNLLNPKAGGIAFVLASMGEQLTAIVDVTIAYPKGDVHIWDFLCGKVDEIRVNVDIIKITPDLLGNYFDDPLFRSAFQSWVNQLWAAKDQTIYKLLGVSTDMVPSGSEIKIPTAEDIQKYLKEIEVYTIPAKSSKDNSLNIN
ncbi:MAG: acyltransferase [Desulfobacterales bacterium]|nr:acyltransferase [Desulfobacterales bacterium]MBF0398407.1 acyltransferase [Desulfobacterales bacterium]